MPVFETLPTGTVVEIPDLPEGWTVRQTRFMYALVNPEGKDVLFGATENACKACRLCLPEFGGVVGAVKDRSGHVDL